MVFGKPGGANPVVMPRRRENHTEYYEATWLNPEGRVRRTRFSIAKHGERKALRLAMAARQRNERIRLPHAARVTYPCQMGIAIQL
ncbi:MAG: AP2/ERF family transcription factor [Kouleothrix sp.]